MTDLAPTPSDPTPEPSAWDKQRAKEARLRDRRDRNEQLFTAVMNALVPKTSMDSLAQRLASVQAALVHGGNPNAKATLVDHLKERPLGMVAHHIGSDAAVPVMTLLLEHGADSSPLDRDGNTLTHTLVKRFWRHGRSDPATVQNNLRAWFEHVGRAHMTTANAAGENPLSLALFALDRQTPRNANGIPDAVLVHEMVHAGAQAKDLPTGILFDLLEKNHRAGFDLAVALGADPHQRRGTTNLWKTWADHQDTPRASMDHDADRRAWMERLIELGVDPIHASGSEPHAVDRSGASALMLLLAAALRQPSVDEVCLTRLKNLGCPVQAPGRYPLHDLAASAKAHHLETLHRLGFDLAQARNDRNETLLHAIGRADLRHILHHPGETRTAEATVDVLLAAGCPPGGLATVPDQVLAQSPLATFVRNTHHVAARATRYDRVAVVKRLIGAGASINEGQPARHLIGHLFYGKVYSATEVSWTNASSFTWQHLFLDAEDQDLTLLLREHGAQLPEAVVPNGMPFLLGLAPSTYRWAQEDQRRRELWNLLVEREPAGWADRFALTTLKWIGQGERHTGLKHERCVELIEWCVSQGVDENIWGTAARAAGYQPGHPMTQHIEQMELRLTLRELPVDSGANSPGRGRPRL